MTPWWLSWVIQVPVLVGTFGTASPKRGRTVVLLGWLLLLAGQAGYFAFGLVTHQYGFLLSSSVFAVLAAYGWRQWRQHAARQRAERPQHRHLATPVTK
jgi:nicotinamide riboside transporter PnuC